MKNCKNIENSLSLYTEGLLSADEQKAVDEHLKACPACAKALVQLQRAGMMAQDLKEVEPPPWFKQKIMTKVREESRKKGFTQKWFYPLRIKIPVQIAATIVITVLAVYIYRSGNEQMKAVLPEARQHSMENKQEPIPAEITKSEETAPVPLAGKKAAAIEAVKKDKISAEVFSGGNVSKKMEMRRNKPAMENDKSLTMKSDLAAEKKQTDLQALPEAPQRYAARQKIEGEQSAEDSSLSGTAKKSIMVKEAAPAAAKIAAHPQTYISLQVADINGALVDVEKILTKYGVKKVTKQLIDGKSVLQAELPAKNLKDILSQLRSLGKVEEKSMPAESGKPDMAVVIEIISN